MNRWAWLAVIVLILAAAVVVIVWIVNPRVDTQIAICAQLIPKDAHVGFTLQNEKGGNIKIDLGQGAQTQLRDTKESADIIEKITACAEKLGRRTIIAGGVNIPEEPLGEVADHWNEEQGLHVDLRVLAPDQQEILNNLRVAPTAGTKAQVMQAFCHDSSDCTLCSPTILNEDMSHVTISLKPDAKTVKVPMTHQPWPVPNPGASLKPWQLVDGQGKRWVYQCGT
jgi:hypothetical protein